MRRDEEHSARRTSERSNSATTNILTNYRSQNKNEEVHNEPVNTAKRISDAVEGKKRLK
jgi:hypothetical protein